MDIIRITTAGSVDDGKSTLIGRLLYDTRSLPADKLEAVELASKRKGLDFTDLSLLTDGLIAEREQGITIDVAYIYFSTPNRKFIIADTPGHIEYTRNMITGASTASVFLILIDARHGITEQTRRHFYIASLLQVKEIAVCINKMDLQSFNVNVFQKIRQDFIEMTSSLAINNQEVVFIPVAAKSGDNVVHQSSQMNWYDGPTLLEFLERIDPTQELHQKPLRFPVQHVIRPHSDEHHDYRGYAGRVTSGVLHVGDDVTVLPTLRSSRIQTISIADEKNEKATANESVVITLEDDVDVSRGNMIIASSRRMIQMNALNATICWMHEQSISIGKMLLLQHGVNRVKAKITALNSVLDIHSLKQVPASMIQLNDIAKVQLKLAKPIFADCFSENPSNGTFILIDEFSNATVAAGFIVD